MGKEFRKCYKTYAVIETTTLSANYGFQRKTSEKIAKRRNIVVSMLLIKLDPII